MNASSDIIATADTGTDSTNYIDLGINNSGYSVGTWTINGALDGYLYTSDTNLSIGAVGANKYVSIFTGGTLAANERLRVTGIGSVGIGTTNPTQSLHVQGSARVTGAVYDSSNSAGTSGQVLQSTATGTQWTTAAGSSSDLYYRVGSNYAGSASSTAQSVLGAGTSVTVTSSTIYSFEGVFGIFRSSAPSSTVNFALQFGGAATVHNIAYTLTFYTDTSYTSITQKCDTLFITTAGVTPTLGSQLTTDTSTYYRIFISGTVNINAGGKFGPQYKLSSTGGAYTTSVGSWFKMTPLTISSGSGASAIASSGTWT